MNRINQKEVRLSVPDFLLMLMTPPRYFRKAGSLLTMVRLRSAGSGGAFGVALSEPPAGSIGAERAGGLFAADKAADGALVSALVPGGLAAVPAPAL